MSTQFPVEGVEMQASELRLADTVQLTDDPWGTALVTQIKDGLVTFWRPYGHTGDFSYTGGVIAYVGLEIMQVCRDSPSTFKVLARKELK